MEFTSIVRTTEMEPDGDRDKLRMRVSTEAANQADADAVVKHYNSIVTAPDSIYFRYTMQAAGMQQPCEVAVRFVAVVCVTCPEPPEEEVPLPPPPAEFPLVLVIAVGAAAVLFICLFAVGCLLYKKYWRNFILYLRPDPYINDRTWRPRRKRNMTRDFEKEMDDFFDSCASETHSRKTVGFGDCDSKTRSATSMPSSESSGEEEYDDGPAKPVPRGIFRGGRWTTVSTTETMGTQGKFDGCTLCFSSAQALSTSAFRATSAGLRRNSNSSLRAMDPGVSPQQHPDPRIDDLVHHHVHGLEVPNRRTTNFRISRPTDKKDLEEDDE